MHRFLVEKLLSCTQLDLHVNAPIVRPSKPENKDKSPLYVAVQNGNVDLVMVLLDNNADPNARGPDKRLALHESLTRVKVGTVGVCVTYDRP